MLNGASIKRKIGYVERLKKWEIRNCFKKWEIRRKSNERV
jgi:hypothetical protein